MDPFGTLAYLARSENRLAVLESIRAEPRSRRAVQEAVDASTVTANRTLGDLEGRGWIVRVDGQYHTTPQGDLVAKSFGDLLGTLALADRLGDMVGHLPISRFDFPLSRLQNAEAVLSSPEDPTKPADHVALLFRDADEIRILANAAPASPASAVAERAIDDADVEVVLSPTLVDSALRNGMFAGVLRTILAAGGSVLRSVGDIPFTLFVTDDTVGLAFVGEGGKHALVVSRDGVVYDWAERTYDRYCRAGTPLSDSDLARVGVPDDTAPDDPHRLG